MTTAKPKIAWLHHNISTHRGGGDFVCAWALETLKDDYDLTYLTWGPDLDWPDLDRYYGTHIAGASLKVRRIPGFGVFGERPFPFHVGLAFLQRALAAISADYDLMGSSYNEVDYGRPGLYYIHTPNYSVAAAQRNLVGFTASPVRRLYHMVARALSGLKIENIERSHTVVNSHWTATIYKSAYPNSKPEVLYPPVLFPNAGRVPWEARRAEFLCIGDLLPEKRTLEAIEIVQRLRQRGHAVELRIIGDGRGPYADAVMKAAHAEGIHYEGRLHRPGVNEFIETRRYGLHMREAESFGIAVAEMAAGGMIPFVRAGGAQEEVVNFNEPLIFKTLDEAVARIEAVLTQPTLQARLRSELAKASEQYSLVTFQKGLRQAVRTALAQHAH